MMHVIKLIVEIEVSATALGEAEEIVNELLASPVAERNDVLRYAVNSAEYN
jgi:hypothetical protein